MKRIILKPGEERRILGGHPWVYGNEVERVLDARVLDACLESGEAVDVESARKVYLGRALANPHSKIIARIYSPSKEGIDKGFFKRRMRAALDRRRQSGLELHREPVRFVFGEADFLPGLIVDCFTGWPREAVERAVSARPLTFQAAEAALGPPSSWLSVQFLTWGMDCRREEILSALEEVMDSDPSLTFPKGIIEKDSAKVRELEGLPLREGVLRGHPPGDLVIFENGFPFAVDLEGGQKTGHFLDQRENRLRAAAFTRGGRTLDCCAYTGGFAIHAARLGADSVRAVDVSASALETLALNSRLNGVEDRIDTVEADIFSALPQYERAKERFDCVILDPPAFAKSRSALEGALRGYKEINLRALRLLNPGGVLVTCSCSHALDEGRFKRMIAEAAADAGRRLVQLDFRYQAADHPILLGYEESLYLKCGYFRAVS
ncbi:MAG: class I SAM-dependent rRNA methyltransferase [Treponema sp.]|jgi:23S rRNA (cytosine1962-C5)-methyltransferase|nr:class I SAM-dependent rRNA methyltransferase [Treponema sp.]